MGVSRIPPPPTRIVIAMLLAAALLFAQWAGLSHRISHAYLQQQQALAYSIPDDNRNGDQDMRHSCAAFDAATVADTIPLPPFVAPLITSVRVLALWAAFISWDAPLAVYFSSRAPPRV
jgi:hypothetical protein